MHAEEEERRHGGYSVCAGGSKNRTGLETTVVPGLVQGMRKWRETEGCWDETVVIAVDGGDAGRQRRREELGWLAVDSMSLGCRKELRLKGRVVDRSLVAATVAV